MSSSSDSSSSHRPPELELLDGLVRTLGDCAQVPPGLVGVLNALTIGVAVADAQGQLVHFNSVSGELLGTSDTGPQLGTWSERFGLFDVTGERKLEDRELPLARALKGATVFGEPIVVRNPRVPEGLVLSIFARPLRDAEGQVCGGVAVFSPEDSQSAIDRSRQHTRDRLFQLVEASPYAIAMMDNDLRYVVCSRSWSRLHGLGDRDLTGQSHPKLLPELVRSMGPAYARALAGNTTQRNQDRVQTASGDEQWYRWRLAPWLDERGQLGGVIEYRERITDQVQSQRALKADELQFRRLYNQTPAMLLSLDAAGQVLTASDKWLSWMGYRRAEVLGRPVLDFLSGESGQRVRGAVFTTLSEDRTAQPLEMELSVRRSDGTHRVSLLSTHTETDDHGAVMSLLCVFVDRTEQKAAEAAIQEQTDALMRSNRDLEEFAYAVSHDLQQPIRAMVGYAQLLERRYREVLDDRARSYLDKLVGASMRMQDLIADMLDFSRATAQRADPQPVPLDHVLDTVLQDLQGEISRTQAKVTVGPLPIVHGHAFQLAQLFQNLVGNALKYRGDDAPVVKVYALELQREWCIRVADNGIGFDPRFADRIFKVFQRLHASDRYSGTGLGLAIVRKVVDGHGGQVLVESVPGKGSTFSVTLPKPPV